MNNVMGKPHALKQVNLSLVRKAILEKGSATRAEIVEATKISVTTVRTLLTEMLENGEIVQAGYDDSIGGRKAVRYQLKKDRFFGAALCLTDGEARYLTVNICGEIQERGSFALRGDGRREIRAFLDALAERIELRSIGVGVPGIVHGLEYRRIGVQGQWETHSIGEEIAGRYGVPVLLENDLNAITLGFGRCFLKKFQDEKCENVNMAYINIETSCISAGFLSGGRILRGWNNYVGELGLFQVDERQTLDELLASPMEDARYAHIVAKLLAGICCVLNPEYIALGGGGFRRDNLPLITENFYDMVPERMAAEILYVEDPWHDYFEGMAYLTANQIFSDVVLIER